MNTRIIASLRNHPTLCIKDHSLQVFFASQSENARRWIGCNRNLEFNAIFHAYSNNRNRVANCIRATIRGRSQAHIVRASGRIRMRWVLQCAGILITKIPSPARCASANVRE